MAKPATTTLMAQVSTALGACGFSIQERTSRRGRVIEASHSSVPDLAPYYVIPTDQWSAEEQVSAKADALFEACMELDHAKIFVAGAGWKGAKSIDQILFELLGLSKAQDSYKARLKDDVAQLVECSLSLGGESISATQAISASSDSMVCVVVAPGGWGKTSFCRSTAYRLAKEVKAKNLNRDPFPILVEFTREVEALPFDDLLARFCRQHQLDANRSGGLAYLLRTARAVLIVDGFDELASTFGLDKARVALAKVLNEACADGGRAIVSSRTQFYEVVSAGSITSEVEPGVTEQEAVLEVPEPLEVVRAHLGPKRKLTRDEQAELERHFGRLPAQLGSSPLAATWTAEEIKTEGLGVLETSRTSSDFYEWYLRRLCDREEQKKLARIITDDGERLLDADLQMAWLQKVALQMLEEGAYELGAKSSEDLAEYLATLLDDAATELEVGTGQEALTSHAAFTSVGLGEVPALEFVHPSLRDFLIARTLVTDGTVGLPSKNFPQPTPELARFLGESFHEGNNQRFEEICAWSGDPSAWRLRIGLGALESPALDVASPGDRRKALTGVLGALNFDQTDVTGLMFDRIDLSNCAFRGSTLRSTRFTDCNLSGADLRGAHLEEVEFLNCRLTDSKLDEIKAVSGYVSDKADRGDALDGAELSSALRDLANEQPPPDPAGEGEIADLGELVGKTLRVFVPKGKARPRKKVNEENLLRHKEIRPVVLSDVIPVLIRENVLYRASPYKGNRRFGSDLATIASWFDTKQDDRNQLEAVLQGLLRRQPKSAEIEQFQASLKKQ